MFKQESWLSSLLLPPACQLPTQRADGACCKAIWVPAFSSPHNVPVECEHVTCFDNKMHLISFLSFIIVFSFSFPFFSRAAHFSTAFPSLTQEITQLDSVPSSLLPCGQNLCLGEGWLLIFSPWKIQIHTSAAAGARKRRLELHCRCGVGEYKKEEKQLFAEGC